MPIKSLIPEADFCLAVPQNMIACDSRALSADTRMGLMEPLYNTLNSMIMVPKFPPYTKQTLCGMNADLAEEFTCSVQARLVLYLMCNETV